MVNNDGPLCFFSKSYMIIMPRLHGVGYLIPGIRAKLCSFPCSNTEVTLLI